MRRMLLVGVIVAYVSASNARAHDGPPYPIFVDEPAGPWTVSIWTDPDVGVGTFFYYLEAPAGSSPVTVEVKSTDVTGEVPDVSGVSVPSEPGEPFQQVGELEFAHRGTWTTTFRVVDRDGTALAVLTYDLEVTPPGLGPFSVALYFIPFAVIGLFWLRGLLAQRAHDRTLPDSDLHSEQASSR